MEEILYSLTDHKVLAIIIGFLLVMLETFAPILPLIAIVLANAFVLGMWMGFLVSWVSSAIASIILYYIANRFSRLKYIQKYKSKEQVKRVTSWIHRQGFNTIFISYACPFIPDFLVTISSGFAGTEIKNYISGMVFGKFVMFLLISYIGEDLDKVFQEPIKIVVFILAVIISWILGRKINNRIHTENAPK